MKLFNSLHQQLFNLRYVNITTILSISVHIEIEPANSTVAYLLIYKFDQIRRLPIKNLILLQIINYELEI